jgi:protein involved in polysaccharide export with SLBB domain
VVLYSKSVYEEVNKSLNIEGLVKNPGEYKLSSNMNIEDAILAAGGFKEYADIDSAILNRESFDFKQGKISERFTLPIDLDYIKGISKQPVNLFPLSNNDIITIRTKPGVVNKKSILVTGEVVYPGNIYLDYSLNTIRSIIEKAGGLKNTANLLASYIVRQGKVVSLNIENFETNNLDILQDGDQLVIASNNGTVTTIGAVYNENQFIWTKWKSAYYYIRNSGGRVRGEAADAYVILPNGKNKKLGFLRNPKILPNSKIVVNRKVKNENQNNSDKYWERLTRVITILTSSLTAAVLASKL